MKFFKIHLLAVLIFLSVAKTLPARNDDTLTVVIDRVIIAGNEKTKNYIILREIPFTFPDTLNQADFNEIKNRIQNLFLFNRVELLVTNMEDSNVLVILVTESWYFFPVPLLFINEHDWSKISYGLQLNHYNFRGRNEKLRLGGWLGYNPAYYVSYFNPWIGSKARFIMGLGVQRRKIENKIFDFDEDRFGFEVIFGKRLNLKMDVQLQFDYNRVELPDEFHHYSISGDGIDFVPRLGLNLRWDYRDLFEYPKNGLFVSLNIRKTGFASNQPDFWRIESDNRFYIPLFDEISLGARQLLVVNHGDLPIYDRTFLGFGERIRGYFSRVLPDPRKFQSYPSPEISLSSLELRFPILPIRYFSIEDGPLIPTLYQDLKFGISGGIFLDSGIAWQDQNQFALDNFFTGYGVGLHIHLPYIYVLRFEFALNDAGETEFIIDSGVSF